MSEAAPEMPLPEDPTVHDQDPTHPRGNKELAERMAHVEDRYQDEARWREGMAESSKIFRTGAVETNLSKAKTARLRGERRAETERQSYLAEHPEITEAAGRVVGEDAELPEVKDVQGS